MKKADRGRRLVLFGLLGAGALLAFGSTLWGSYLGRRIAWLEVERVEISGMRLIAPHEVLAASGIREGQHLLDEREVWEDALRQHPVIADAQITRKAPNTLRIRISEKRPVALIPEETLRPATGAGEILPVDPTLVPVDLPIVHGTLADSTDAEDLRRILAETERLTVLDPMLMTEVSEIRASREDPNVLVLIHPIGEILLPIGASAKRTAELRSVVSDVRRRYQAEPNATASAGRARLDLRFEDQVVVRPSSSRELS